MSDNKAPANPIDAQRQKILQAKQQLEQRRKDRETVKKFLSQKSNNDNAQQQLGKQFIQEFNKALEITKNKLNEEKKDNDVSSSKHRAAGRRVLLEEAPSQYYHFKDQKKIETSSEEAQFDPISFEEYLKSTFGELNEETFNTSGNQIRSTFVRSEDAKAWPPSLKNANDSKSQKRGIQYDDEDFNDEDEDGIEEWTNEAHEEKPEIMVMDINSSEKLISSGDFLSRFHTKSKWIERALGINENIGDIFIASMTQEIRKKLNKGSKLTSQNKYGFLNVQGRSIGYISCSKINGDWFLATYDKRLENTFAQDSEGLICIWNYILPKHPEYTLEATNMVTVAHFHPTNNNIILGATSNGQILQWDIRVNKKAPVSRTLFSGSGHTAPVFEMKFLPSMNSKMHHFITVSNDGKICVWRDTELKEPSTDISLEPADEDPRPIELATSCFSYCSKDTNQLFIGGEGGRIYRIETVGQSKDKLPTKSYIRAHEAPITNLQFHNGIAFNRRINDDISSLFVTSSFDWTVKLWHMKYTQPLAVFDNMTDYVYDVKWSPTHPAVFACCDGSGKITLFNLNEDFVSPISMPIQVTSNNVALTKLSFSNDGKQILVGDSDGFIHCLACDPSLYATTDSTNGELTENVHRTMKTAFPVATE